MFANFESFTDFLCKHNKTPNQVFYCLCIYSDLVGTNKQYSKKGLLYKVMHHESRERVTRFIFDDKDLEELVEYEWIELGRCKKSRDGHYKGIDLCNLGRKFIEDFESFTGSSEASMMMVREFYAIYPNYSETSKGEKMMLKNTSPENITIPYLNAIYHDNVIHQEIVSITTKAKKLGYIKCSIANYIQNRVWEQLKEELSEKKELGSIEV